VSISSHSTGHELEKLIQEKLNLHDQNLKMICSGRMIQPNEQLQTQNVRVSLTYYLFHFINHFSLAKCNYLSPFCA
jgi:hypothetical protein